MINLVVSIVAACLLSAITSLTIYLKNMKYTVISIQLLLGEQNNGKGRYHRFWRLIYSIYILLDGCFIRRPGKQYF